MSGDGFKLRLELVVRAMISLGIGLTISVIPMLSGGRDVLIPDQAIVDSAVILAAPVLMTGSIAAVIFPQSITRRPIAWSAGFAFVVSAYLLACGLAPAMNLISIWIGVAAASVIFAGWLRLRPPVLSSTTVTPIS